eukprot:s268_g24.t2
MAPVSAHNSSQVEVILSDEERDVLEQRAEAMALTSLQALPAEKLRKALPAVKQGILKRLLSQASHDEALPEKAAPAAEAPPVPPVPPAPPAPELDSCDDEELDRLRCSLRQKPKELPPPQDGVEAFGDDPWFAPQSEVRVALSEAAEAHHGSFKILVGDPAEEIARICQRPLFPCAVLRLGGASGGFGEPDVAYAYRQLSRALHPDKNPDHPDAGEAFRRLKEAQDELKSSLEEQRRLLRILAGPFRSRDEDEMQMKRPQCALLAEACRLLAAVLALTGQGVVPQKAHQRAAACLRLPEGGWAAAHASTEALLAQWRSESGGLLEVLAHDALRTAYDCAPKRYRAQFLCLLARCAQVESNGSDGCVRRQWSKIWEHFPEIQLWQKLRELILKKRQERLEKLLGYLFVGYRIFEVQLERVKRRLEFLNGKHNFPARKEIVLPSLRGDRENEEVWSVESRSELDTIYCVTSDSEVEEVAASSTGSRSLGVWAEPGVAAAVTPALRSSSANPGSVAATIRISSHNPLLSPFAIIPEEILRRNEIEIHRGPCSASGKQLVLSWDFHQVLDKFRASRRYHEKCSWATLPTQCIQELQRASGFPDIAQIVLSYCHIQDTKDNVLWNQSQFSRIIITRKPAGAKGKLACLKKLVRTGRVLHIDDSFEVLSEFKKHQDENPDTNICAVGIRVEDRPQVPGFFYLKNIREVVDLISNSERYRHLGI